MTRNVWTSAISASAIAVLVSGAEAATFTWQGDVNNSWSEGGNWDQGTAPGTSDDVVIPALPGINPRYPTLDATTTVQSLDVQEGTLQFTGGHDLTVTGVVNVETGGKIDINSGGSKLIISGVDTMDVDSGGIIWVSAENAQLELTGASSSGHILDGNIALKVAGAVFNVPTNSVKIIGSGQFVGEHADAVIQIASGKTLTNAMNDASNVGFRGPMQINGAGTFLNQGRVTATSGTMAIGVATFTNQGRAEASGGTLDVGATTIADTSGADRWVVANTANSRLLFSVSTTSLVGNFVLAKELELGSGVDIYSCGQLTYNSGAFIDVGGAGSAFRYGTFDGASTCSNPFDTQNLPGCGGNSVFEVSSDKSPC